MREVIIWIDFMWYFCFKYQRTEEYVGASPPGQQPEEQQRQQQQQELQQQQKLTILYDGKIYVYDVTELQVYLYLCTYIYILVRFHYFYFFSFKNQWLDLIRRKNVIFVG